MVVLVDLRAVVSFERLGQFVAELDEFGGGLAGEFSGQTKQRQIVGLQHARQRALRGVAVRAAAWRAARSSASLSR